MKTRIIEAIKGNEKAMKRINKAIDGTREMKDGYLDTTAVIVGDKFEITFEEMQEVNHWALIAECIVEIVKEGLVSCLECENWNICKQYTKEEKQCNKFTQD